MLTTQGVALEGGPTSAATSRSAIRHDPDKVLLDVAEMREEPPPPEPLEAARLRRVVWVAPALVAALLGLWWGADEGMTRPDAAVVGLYAVWVDTASGWGWFDRLPLAIGAAASAGLLAKLGIELSGRRTGLLAGMLYALLPGTGAVALGPSVLLVALSLTAALLVVRMGQRPTVRRAVPYTSALVAVGVVAPAALVIALPHCILVSRWGHRPDRRLMLWGLAVIGSLAAVEAIGGLLGVVTGLPRLTSSAGVSASTLNEWSTVTFGGPLLAGSVLGVSFLALTVRGAAGAATGYAVVSTVALVAMAASVAPQAADALPIIAPAWCLLAGIALSRIRMARAGCAVALLAVLGLPGQVLLRQVEPDPGARRPVIAGQSQSPGSGPAEPVVSR